MLNVLVYLWIYIMGALVFTLILFYFLDFAISKFVRFIVKYTK